MWCTRPTSGHGSSTRNSSTGSTASRSPGFDHYNPVTVDGRYTQHLTSILGQFQKAINWTTDDMIAKYGEEIVTQGFTGERVADAIAYEGVDVAHVSRCGSIPVARCTV